MRTSVILGVGSVLVLLGAYFASKLLVSDVAAPVVTTVVSPLPAVVPQPVIPRAAEPETRTAPAPEAPLAQRPAPPLDALPVAHPGDQRLPEPNPEPLPADVATSPFQGDSKELDYAESLLAEADPGLDRLRSAQEVFKRCVQQEPDNQRCQNGLGAARQRLIPIRPSDLKPAPLPPRPVPPPR